MQRRAIFITVTAKFVSALAGKEFLAQSKI
jgi:hypothetical protein